MSKVSVLVAAYNAQQYIEKCLQSLLTQTLTDLEVLCVDDASTDNTPHILDEAAARDNRLKVLHLKENGGQAKARNIALQMAEGDYICMLDSDDWYAPDALQVAADVLDKHPDTDCVLFQLRQVFPNYEREYPMPSFDVMSGKQAFEASLTWAIHGLYMVRTELHKRFPFDDSSKAYSDDNTTRLHFLHARQVRQCEGVYFYRQHEASVTHSISPRRFDYLLANKNMRRIMLQEHVEQRLLELYEKERWLNLVGTYMFYVRNRRKLSSEDARYGIQVMKMIWKDVDTKLLPWKLKMKPGYMPMKPWWGLFRMQEEAYFALRWLVKGE